MRSPVTIRSVLLFFAILFVIYIVWRDIANHREQTLRYKRVDEQINRWDTIQSDTNAHIATARQNIEETNNQMSVLKEMSASLDAITKTMQTEKANREAEHKEIARQLRESARIIDNANRRTAPRERKGSIRKFGLDCWQTVTRTEKFGSADVVKRELRRVPCPK